jgi:hypothetical protein
MKKNAIVIGDLHGNISIVRDIFENLWEQTDQFIFVGDYFDSFNWSPQTQIDLVNFLIEYQKNYPERIILLMGNHELSYLHPKMRCSGHSFYVENYIENYVDLKRYLLDNLKIYHVFNDWLITHAGVSQRWIPIDDQNKEQNLTRITELLTQENNRIYEIGSSRGGWMPSGGPFWCDFWGEFKTIPGIKQIFGHTSWRPEHLHLENTGILSINDENYLIDCLQHKREVLRINSDSSVDIVEV